MKHTWLIVQKYGLISMVFFAFYGCNLTYKVRNQNYSIEEVVHFSCGKITAELVGKGNSKFVFKQQFDLDSPIMLQPDSLHIYFNDKIVEAAYNIKSSKQSGRGRMVVQNNFTLDAAFQLGEGVFDGDTIKVFANGYIDCKEQISGIDTIIYSFTNNFRIFGVNYN